MSYVSNADVEARLGSAAYVQLTDDDGDGQADSDVVDEARLGAEGEVDSYLARRYQTPIDLDEHPELAGVLASFTLDLIEYRLRSRRPPVPKESSERYARAVEWLRGVAEGSLELPAQTALASGTVRGTIARAIGERRILSREELESH